MPNLPPSTDFTNSSVTEGGFKTAMTYLREYLASLLGADGTVTSALSALGSLFNAVSSKSANYTVIASDRGKTIQCTATLELALTAAATLGSNFVVTVDNIGSGTVTINPNGTELIDGLATLTLNAGQSTIIYCDGVNFYSIGASAGVKGNRTAVFYSSGTWTVPDDIETCYVACVGGAGGGGGSGSVAGGMGGAGGTVFASVIGLTPKQSITITVGAGGAGNNASSGTGGAGGASSFGSYATATGGAGGPGNNSGAAGNMGVGSVSGSSTMIRGSSAASVTNTKQIPVEAQGTAITSSTAAVALTANNNYPAGYGGQGEVSNASNATGGTGGIVVIYF